MDVIVKSEALVSISCKAIFPRVSPRNCSPLQSGSILDIDKIGLISVKQMDGTSGTTITSVYVIELSLHTVSLLVDPLQRLIMLSFNDGKGAKLWNSSPTLSRK